jgi:hypothetical protein
VGCRSRPGRAPTTTTFMRWGTLVSNAAASPVCTRCSRSPSRRRAVPLSTYSHSRWMDPSLPIRLPWKRGGLVMVRPGAAGTRPPRRGCGRRSRRRLCRARSRGTRASAAGGPPDRGRTGRSADRVSAAMLGVEVLLDAQPTRRVDVNLLGQRARIAWRSRVRRLVLSHQRRLAARRPTGATVGRFQRWFRRRQAS